MPEPSLTRIFAARTIRYGTPYDNAPQTREELINQENFGFSGRNPARVGGENPDLNPAS